ncbi:MAG: DUF502 domain-containing protein [Candidatus Hydrogenedentes bacterium]|nr:DUF502 domain-containing protein [Candidatus Hydrogenedentota bacterium]
MKTMRKTRRKKTFWGRLRHNIRRRLLSGLLVVVPLGISAFVINFLYVITAKPLASIIRMVAGELPRFYVMIISVALFLTLLYVIGLVTNVFVGRKLLNLAEAIIQRIPVVKTVYTASKQVVEAVSNTNASTSYKSSVLVEFPNPGALSVGFVTGRITDSNGVEYLKVFIPTTPNPTTGFFQLIKPERVIQSSLSVEDGVKFMMSCGIVSPDMLEVASMGPEIQPAPPQPDDDDYDWVEEEVEEEPAGPDAAGSQ